MWKKLLYISACAAMTSCAAKSTSVADNATGATTDSDLLYSEACATRDLGRFFTQSEPLDSAQIKVLSWNKQKGSQDGAFADLARLGNDADLLLLQEAVAQSEQYELLDPEFEWMFSRGYQSSGVMTASKATPLEHCSHGVQEPWLRSPKMTSVSRYALSDTDETLLVVNLHMVNFTLGVDAVLEQLARAAAHIEEHDGPVIMSGDFNTWSAARERVVQQEMERLRLTPIAFAADQRTRVFGRPLDHVYVRGVQARSSTSHVVTSSDHNPITVVLELVQ